MIKLDWLVTGTGRCGTVYAARLLTSVGITCGHEAIYSHEGINAAIERLSGKEQAKMSFCSMHEMKETSQWKNIPNWIDTSKIVAESSYMAAPYVGDKTLENTKVIHLVRNPVRVVDSFCNALKKGKGYFSGNNPENEYEAFIFNSVKHLWSFEMTQYDRACLFYVMWNNMIENRRPDRIFVRAEDCPDAMLKALGRESSREIFENKKVNKMVYSSRRFRISDIESKEIKCRFIDIGERYGYNMSDPKEFI